VGKSRKRVNKAKKLKRGGGKKTGGVIHERRLPCGEKKVKKEKCEGGGTVPATRKKK